MSTLKIRSDFTISVNGRTVTGKQGATTDAADDYFEITVDGKVIESHEQLATATVRTLWDDDSHTPVDFDYFFFWADQDCYLQFVGATINFTVKVEAKVPFVLSFDSILAAADTTDITGGTEPTLEDIDHVVLGNYSGNTMNYQVALID